MRTFVLSIFAALLLLLSAPAQSQAGVDFGISVDKDGVNSFYLAIGSHYEAPEAEIVVIRKKKIPDEEMPVLFFIARMGGVSSASVLAYRLKGKTWIQVSRHFGVGADYYYISTEGNPGPPYGKALGHYKHRKMKDWKKIDLSDTDVINLVNLRFVTDHYGYSADEVIKLRSGGHGFIAIHKDVKAKKAKKNKNAKKHVSKDKSKGKGKKK